MPMWQALTDAVPGLTVRRRGRSVELRWPDRPPALLTLVEAGTLTAPLAADLASTAAERSTLVTYARASRDAREILRDAGVSYVGKDGRALLQAPGMFVVLDDPVRATADADPLALDDDSRSRNPFAVKASRVARWLLLHPGREFAVSELARDVELSSPAVSRVVRALADQALVLSTDAAHDARRHHVVLDQPRRLLDAWLPHWQRRRIRQRVWDIGARDAAEALEDLTEAGNTTLDQLWWRIGGTAGAKFLARAVEPADVLIWVSADHVTSLARALDPQPARAPARGTLRVLVPPDPWILSIAPTGLAPVRVADPVQLWLDCASEGERALEAAEAVAREMAW